MNPRGKKMKYLVKEGRRDKNLLLYAMFPESRSGGWGKREREREKEGKKCVGNWLTALGIRELLFVMLADFYDINTPALADFKL